MFVKKEVGVTPAGTPVAKVKVKVKPKVKRPPTRVMPDYQAIGSQMLAEPPAPPAPKNRGKLPY